ncbi:hypothetical protein MP638_001730 [Amoeboaphelidium occidentale]|nr:hypothetical protein MP638_001730 [Amoeboaphelidium occidentale]
MPKYYCDYCDIYLTHDARKVIRDHNDGWKHKNQVREYYATFAREQMQSMIDRMTLPGGFRPVGPPPPLSAGGGVGMPPGAAGFPRPPMPPPPRPGQMPPNFNLPGGMPFPGPPPQRPPFFNGRPPPPPPQRN